MEAAGVSRHRNRERRARVLALILLVAAGNLRAGVAGADRHSPLALEYEIKAVFLANFAKYVEWPEHSALADPKAPIVVGVLGEDPFGRALDEAVQDKTAHGRRMVVRRYRAPEQVKGCHVVFVSSSEVKQAGEILRALGKDGVLTVDENRSLPPAGSMITFTMDHGKVRFEIDVDAARRAGLRISSQLLKLAAAVRGTP